MVSTVQIGKFADDIPSYLENKFLSYEDLESHPYKGSFIYCVGDYETIGGYIIEQLGRIPNKNEHLFLQIGQILIRKASSKRIEQVQIFMNQ